MIPQAVLDAATHAVLARPYPSFDAGSPIAEVVGVTWGGVTIDDGTVWATRLPPRFALTFTCTLEDGRRIGCMTDSADEIVPIWESLVQSVREIR